MNISEKQITEYRIDCAGCDIAEVINKSGCRSRFKRVYFELGIKRRLNE